MFKSIVLVTLAGLTLAACDSKPVDQAAPVVEPAAEATATVEDVPAVDAGAAPVEAVKPLTSDK